VNRFELKLPKIDHKFAKYFSHEDVLLMIIIGFCMVLLISLTIYGFLNYKKLNNTIEKQKISGITLEQRLNETKKKLTALQNEDQYKINQDLKTNVNKIQESYKSSLDLYNKILDLKAQKEDVKVLDQQFAQGLNFLSDLNYASGSAVLKNLALDVKKKQDEIAARQAALVPAQNVTQSNTPPSGGFSAQSVTTDAGNFTVYIVAADLGSTKVIVDTASDSDCGNNCPVTSLGDYVARNGAYAGINGSYFCPAEYPSCAGKTGSFDLLVMNKNKHYFNSDNNVYSTNPAVIFLGNSVRFVGQALEWGRDTGVDAVLSNYPMLVSGGNVTYGGGGDNKFSQRGSKGFVANKGNTAYIGDVLNATMAESAKVLKAMGMDNAMNLDEGGSTALWAGGYKLGPGRNIPNAILFLRK
jgi:hypothetical protein